MKQTIRLTENELHNLIKESVNNILSELDWRTAYRAGLNAMDKSGHYDTNHYDSIKYNRQANKFFDYASKKHNTQYGFPEDFDDEWEKHTKKAQKMKNSKNWEYNPETNKARLLDDNGTPIWFDYWEDVPQEFYPTQGQLKKLAQRDKDTTDFHNDKSVYRSGKWRQKDVIEPDEYDYLDRLAQRHKRKKQPSQIHKNWQDVLDYDYNTNNINI